MQRKPFIPPGGFQGFSQQTLAVQAMLNKPRRTARKTTRRKRAAPVKRRKRVPGPVGKRRAPRKKKPARLVKGSVAARRHMAKLRRMRRR